MTPTYRPGQLGRRWNTPAMGRQTVLAPPWKFSATPAGIHSAAPLIGQHNYRVFVELLGETVANVEEWTREGIID